jgi:RNA polymerase sigma-70 factor (ECF subfamily)
VKAPAGESAERLLIEAAQKDRLRFAALYELHFERVYAFVARRVREREAAQDVTADVFHKALANLGRFEWRGTPFSAWLLTIAAHAIIDRGKRAARERELPACEPPAPADLADAERRGRLFQLVDRLPPDQRRVVVMRFAEERTTREIAHALGRSEGAVKQLQLRGLQRLREWMGEPND